MRNALVETLLELAENDERVFLLTADLGWSVLERFADAFPARFLNVGVAEQNMAGIATGLAQLGYIPYIYSIANFVSMRCYEQIRNGPILHQLPVRVIGVGGGYAYGHAGPSHHALEDLAIFRIHRGMTVIAPADPAQTRAALQATHSLPGPVYFRVGKGNNPNVPGLHGRFALGIPELIVPGADLLFLTTGAIVTEVVRAAEILARTNISAAVAVLAHLQFTASSDLIKLLASYRAVITVEEGVATGGLGSLVAETIVQYRLPCSLNIRAINEPFLDRSGSPSFLMAQSGLGAVELAKAAGQANSDRRAA